MTHIAVIALAPGQVGFYDDLSGIHLSLTNTEAKIFPGVNTAGIINAVKSGKITVVSGSLGSETFVYQEATRCMPTYYRLLEKKQKTMLKNQMIKPVMISEPMEVNPIKDEKIEVEVELIQPMSELEIVEEQAEVVVEQAEVVVEQVEAKEEVPVAKKKAKKKKEAKED